MPGLSVGTNKRTSVAASAGINAAQRIAPRNPNVAASTAPTAGPTVVPMYWAPVTIPRREVSRDSGTVTLVRATAAGMKPEKRPWNASAIDICQGAPTKAAMSVVGVARYSARKSISFRPIRSESTPQNGPVTSRAMPCVVVATATQKRAFASLVAPIASR